jgi:transcriptional regulator with XRE-family HTH domain
MIQSVTGAAKTAPVGRIPMSGHAGRRYRLRDLKRAHTREAKTLGEIDERIAAFIRKAREDKDLTRAELAPLLGLSMQVYGRYERAFSKMHVTRMIHLCEILGFMPMEMLFSAAPHLWGRTPEEARDTMELAQQVVSLPHGTKRDLLALVKKMVALERAADGAAAETQKGEEGRL